MYLILSSIAAFSILGYSSYVGITKLLEAAEGKGRHEGERRGLERLVKFGPEGLRQMCLETGIRFREQPNSEFEQREVQESLRRDIREELKREQRASMLEEVMREVRAELKAEYRSEMTRSGLE
ncbi:hypothetical protein B0O99DRAFT_129516 [Bisporella sp. PMI_857]|nr:hypothetical protein B0O99DRAFT_129516 [Bisporella sp. PMI_857]